MEFEEIIKNFSDSAFTFACDCGEICETFQRKLFSWLNIKSLISIFCILRRKVFGKQKPERWRECSWPHCANLWRSLQIFAQVSENFSFPSNDSTFKWLASFASSGYLKMLSWQLVQIKKTSFVELKLTETFASVNYPEHKEIFLWFRKINAGRSDRRTFKMEKRK